MRPLISFVIVAALALGLGIGGAYLLDKDKTKDPVVQQSLDQGKLQTDPKNQVQSEPPVRVATSRPPRLVVPGEVDRRPESLSGMPLEVQNFFSSEEMVASGIYTVNLSDGSKSYVWEGAIRKSLLDAYRGWRSRLGGWKLISAVRQTSTAYLEYKNEQFTIIVDLFEKGQVLDQKVKVVQNASN